MAGRRPMPGMGHISGPVAGIDRGLLAMMNPHRNRPRKTIDASGPYIQWLEQSSTIWDVRDAPQPQPHSSSQRLVLPSAAHLETDSPNNYCTRHVHTSMNKIKAPVNAAVFSPDARRITTGSAAGEFTLWNGNTFNFDTIIPGHEYSIQAMKYTRSGEYMITADEGGVINYWTSNMSRMMEIRPGEIEGAHSEAIKSLAVAPSDRKFATCSLDGTVKVWDFWTATPEHTLEGHNSNVNSVSWHPYKALIASCGKDNMVKLWDAKEGKEVRNISGHTSWALSCAWNDNGWWLLSAGKDNMIRCYDIRMMKVFQQMTSEHKGVTVVNWHPFSEKMFAAGCTDGAIQYWSIGPGLDYPQAEIPHAHDFSVWDLAWHPGGSIVVSVSNDHSTKFWARSRPGDTALQYAYQGNPLKGHPPNNNPNTVPVPSDLFRHDGGDVGGKGGSSMVPGGPGASASGLQARTFADLQADEDAQDRERGRFIPTGAKPDAVRGDALRRGREHDRDGDGGDRRRDRVDNRPVLRQPLDSRPDLRRDRDRDFRDDQRPDMRRERDDYRRGDDQQRDGGGGGGPAERGPIAGLIGGGPSKASIRGPPGEGYTCRFCGQGGHWIEDCEALLAHKAAQQASRDRREQSAQQQQQQLQAPQPPVPDGYGGGGGGGGGGYGMGMDQGMGGGGGRGGGGGGKKQPGPGYVCKKCNVPGHWMEDCTLFAPAIPRGIHGGGGGPSGPRMTNQQLQAEQNAAINAAGAAAAATALPLATLGVPTGFGKRPPPGYICHGCGARDDHFKAQCPVIAAKDLAAATLAMGGQQQAQQQQHDYGGGGYGGGMDQQRQQQYGYQDQMMQQQQFGAYGGGGPPPLPPSAGPFPAPALSAPTSQGYSDRAPVAVFDPVTGTFVGGADPFASKRARMDNPFPGPFPGPPQPPQM